MTTQHDERKTSSVERSEAGHNRGPSLENGPGPKKGPGAAALLAPVARRLLGGRIPIRLVFWDGTELGPKDSESVLYLRSKRALSRIIWSPDELGVARAFISGELDYGGSLFALLKTMRAAILTSPRPGLVELARTFVSAVRLGAVTMPVPRPPEEARLTGTRHSKRRDAAAVTHHYDVSNEFYRLILGPSMTYSCAYFTDDAMTLEAAQQAKHDLVCRKLGLGEHRDARLLDVGCGWGSMAMHAAKTYGARVVGVTLSPAQAEFARSRIKAAGLDELIEIRLQDYRELRGERFDAISSVGMFEHVGTERMHEYFQTLFALLEPEGRLLNHAISRVGGSRLRGRMFINRYVFPDGELVDVARVLSAMQRVGFEIRDVESLREHYSETLHAWVENLDHGWDEAVSLVGESRARVWKLYMAASANGFDVGKLAVHQVLGIAAADSGESGMPRSRAGWVTA